MSPANTSSAMAIPPTIRGYALVVDDEASNRLILRSFLKRLGYQVAEAQNGRDAVAQFQAQAADVVFMDVMMPEMDGYAATTRIKQLAGEQFVPVIFLTAITDESALVNCIEAGGDDFLTKPFSHTILRSKLQALERIRTLHRQVDRLYSQICHEEEFAREVFSTILGANNVALEAIPHRLQSAAIFSGDLLLTARAPSGDLHLLLGDFTGHGLSAALGALPTADVFRTMTAKGFGPEQILSAINQKLHLLLPVGMFLAASFVRVANSLDHVQIANCGLPEGLILDSATAQIHRRITSQLLPLGILPRQDIAAGLQYIPIQPGWRVLLASDGVIEAHDPNGALFGQERFEAALAASAGQPNALAQINAALERFCGNAAQNDDISLVEIPCDVALFPAVNPPSLPLIASIPSAAPADWFLWQTELVLEDACLGRLDPVPLLLNQIQELEGGGLDPCPLFTVINELYRNALEHGILGLESARGNSRIAYLAERQSRLDRLASGRVRLSAVCEQVANGRQLRIRVEDSGAGFNSAAPQLTSGIDRVRRHCEALTYFGAGNQVEALCRLEP